MEHTYYGVPRYGIELRERELSCVSGTRSLRPERVEPFSPRARPAAEFSKNGKDGSPLKTKKGARIRKIRRGSIG